MLFKNPENPLGFDVYEVFADKESFELHQQRVKASNWGKVTVNVERHYELFERIGNNQFNLIPSKLVFLYIYPIHFVARY
ncbi:hypothetical protein [Marinomonas ostreistagni]|uniref:Antibiotic biosynthesis monooxygenase n=1 Tax=Marinomonas ostreistagni TaxID=359209 RepID=A0ABS0ZB61_9GAMM|nr:hypothetical protein [Marinomonas ostreistagni]MBJ7550891.1 hypothetical protein [Marinomonas ostreistagni]